MSEAPTEQLRGSRRTVALSRLYLDPNNFRIVDHEDYTRVAPEDVFDADVQRRTNAIVLGRSQEQVRDLIASIKENGWLDIDPILVQEKDARTFLVVEGNRRVATLKYLQHRHEKAAIDLGRLDSARFSQVPVVIHDAAEREHMVMMGLHHITGKRRWPAINRALAIKRLQEHFHGDADAVCRALGISKREFNLSVRTLSLVDTYRASDYGDQFQSDQYNLFREILSSPTMRDWLGWDHAKPKAAKTANLERLFDWMSRGEDTETAQEGADGAPQEVPPIITTVGHIRELAKVIDDPVALKRLDETRSLQEATLSSTLLVKSEIERAFAACDNGIQKLNARVGELQAGDLDRVDQLIGKLQGVALARNRQPLAPGGNRLPREPFNEITQGQFSTIEIGCYRGIDGLVLDSPGKVNLIVGVNNAGKTSLLEAIHLLAHQNDEQALLDVIRWRGRVERDPDPVWLVEQLPPFIRLAGRFDQIVDDGTSLKAKLLNEPGSDIGDQTDFLARLIIESDYGGRTQSTDVAFFGYDRRRTSFKGQHWLCRSAFTSPFWSSRPEILAHSNKESLEVGTKQQIIDFIKEHIDSRLLNIELADRFSRFLVSHQDFTRAPDLASFGEGVRRVFEIGLLFAGVRGGVLLIDEFENAIHTELLVPFTRIVQQLAVALNVQVFLTTHSKEAIDALLLNEYQISDIVGYAISRAGKGTHVRRYDGKKMLRLHDAIDFDLRGIR